MGFEQRFEEINEENKELKEYIQELTNTHVQLQDQFHKECENRKEMEKKATKMMKDIKEKWERTKKEDISSINEKLEAEYKVNESLRGKISNQAEKESKLQKEMKSLNDLVLKYQGELKEHQDKANKEKKMRRQSVDNYSDRIVKLQEELNKEKTARLAKEKAMENMKQNIIKYLIRMEY